jgi:hypothetical protein
MRGRDEAPVFGGEDRQVRRAVGRLRRLVVGLNHARCRNALQLIPVNQQPLAEPERARARTHSALEARLDDGLRQTDLGRDAEAFVNRCPFAQESAVAIGIGQQEETARRVVDDRAHARLEKPGHFIAAAIEIGRKRDPGEHVGKSRVFPDGIAGPVAFGWKRDEKPARQFASEGNRAVGDDEQVLPERIRGAIRRHRVPIGLEPVARRRVERTRFLRGPHARAELRREGECG